jgi:hypothetical protein
VAVFTDVERLEAWDRRQAGELNRSMVVLGGHRSRVLT